MSTELKTYYVQKDDEELQIIVPATWKVTFGPVAVGKPNKWGDSKGSMALRFYESDTKQRAIFTGVKSFRDASIPLKKRVKKVVGKDKYELDAEGNKKLVEKAKVSYTWVDME